MNKLSKKRIIRILETHCVMEKASLMKNHKDEYGDVTGAQKYLECDVYFSALLHRYNPHISYDIDDVSITNTRYTPMAILPYDEPIEIEPGHILRITGKEYTITFCEDVNGYYYLLSLSPKQ